MSFLSNPQTGDRRLTNIAQRSALQRELTSTFRFGVVARPSMLPSDFRSIRQGAQGHDTRDTDSLKSYPSQASGISSAWIDSQVGVNHATYRIRQSDPSIRCIRIAQTVVTGRPFRRQQQHHHHHFHHDRHRLSIHTLLQSLCGSTTVEVLSCVNIVFDEEYARKLARALCHSDTVLSSLRLCPILPQSLPPLCQALKVNSTLSELSLTFQQDVPRHSIRLLLQAIKKNRGLRALKIYRLNLMDDEVEDFSTNDNDGNMMDFGIMEQLANALFEDRKGPPIRDLRLTSCQLTDIAPLARAIHQSNVVQRLDLSLNAIDDHDSVAMLLATPSLRFLSLSHNRIGSPASHHPSQQDQVRRCCQPLKTNTTLQRLDLDMNPLSRGFCRGLLDALESNTSLLRLSIFTSSASPSMASEWVRMEMLSRIRHLVALNEAGRGLLRKGIHSYRMDDSESGTDQVTKNGTCGGPPDECARVWLPHLLERVKKEPDLIFGLLREDPQLIG